MLALLYAASALVCAWLALAAWRRRGTTAAVALAVNMAGLVWWSLFDVLDVLIPRHPTSSLQLGVYPGVGLVVAGFYCLCIALVDRDWRPSRRLLLLLAIEPVLISVAAATNPLHHLVVMPDPSQPAGFGFGLVFWVHSVYSYALLTYALVRVLRRRRHASALHARQLTTLLVAAMLPTIGNVITLAGASGDTDMTALFFVLTGLLNAYAIFRQGLFEVVPIARAQVLERLDVAIIVLDELDRLADVNATAIALLERVVPPGVPTVGTPAAVALGGLASLLTGGSGEHHVRLTDGGADLDLRVNALQDKRERPIGRVLVVNDVTAATEARRQLSDSNDLLQQQLVMIERLRGELAEQAVRDHLTGLHNRRHLSRVLSQQVEHAAATGEPLSVVLLDVDHFKSVNDRYGHAAGDQLLQVLGRVLQSAVRPGDTVARYGGEEFVVVLPGVPLDEALRRAEAIREQCRRITLAVPGGRVSPTLSAGVATTGVVAPLRAEDLLESADSALYRAKAAGRDRVVGPALAG